MESEDVKKIISEAKVIFEKDGDSFENEYADKLKIELPDKPFFPTFIFFISIVKDVLDLLDFTGVGVIITTFFSVIIWMILFLWMWGKISWWQKGVTRWALRRLVYFMLGEMTPYAKMIPFSSIFVVLAHNHEKKVVQLFYDVADKLRSAGIGSAVNMK